MIFKQIPVGPMQNFSYIIGDEKSKEAAVVDAGWEIDRLMSEAKKENLEIKKVILTHSHYDHVQQAGDIAVKAKAEVYLHELEYDDIKKFIRNNQIKVIKLKESDTIDIGKIKIRIIHTPGHTPGAICLFFDSRLITGDTLFVGAIGRVDLPGGDAAKLFESLQKLKKLDDGTEIYPGHDYGSSPHSTIGSEKKANPYFMCKTKAEFFEMIGL